MLKNAVALIGDVVVTYRSNAGLIQQLRHHKAGDLIEYCSRNENQDIREYGDGPRKHCSEGVKGGKTYCTF